MPFLTVFTPSYNRAYRLSALYESLCRQTFIDFEWLIVDDGSSDNTEEIINRWITDGKIAIRYIKQQNGGKHRAINKGVIEARGELFFIVDSDDVLLPSSLFFVAENYNKIKDNELFCGLAGSRGNPQGHRIGGYFATEHIDCSCLDFRLRHKIKGDMAEVFRTEILRQFPFPEFDGEKFCPEALIWNRIGQKYIMRFMPDIIYITEYLPDGLTAKITKLRHVSPRASIMYYAEFTKMPIPLVQRIKGAVNFWRFRVPSDQKYNINLFLSLIGFIPGKLMRFRDKLNHQM